MPGIRSWLIFQNREKKKKRQLVIKVHMFSVETRGVKMHFLSRACLQHWVARRRHSCHAAFSWESQMPSFSCRHTSGSYHCRAWFLFYAPLRIFIRSVNPNSWNTGPRRRQTLGVVGVNSEPVGSRLSLQYLDLECFISIFPHPHPMESPRALTSAYKLFPQGHPHFLSDRWFIPPLVQSVELLSTEPKRLVVQSTSPAVYEPTCPSAWRGNPVRIRLK